MKPTACLLIFDGFADWEPAHAFCQINKSGRFDVVIAGFSSQSVTSMAGLKIAPDIAIEDIDQANTAFFMLPGGDMWESNSHPDLGPLLRSLHQQSVLIGAICAATLEIARVGLTRGIRHTSNAKSYLKAQVPSYKDDDFYVDELAVADRNLITASGLGSVEFAREVIRALKLYSDSDGALWFDMFKRGVMPVGIT